MGRNAGYLAMYVGLAVGATAVLVPEEKIDFDDSWVPQAEADDGHAASIDHI